MGGKKRPRGEVAGGASSNNKKQQKSGNGGASAKAKKNKHTASRKHDKGQSMDSWIANLAKQAATAEPSSAHSHHPKQSTTKAERIEKRAAKQSRRQEKRRQKFGRKEEIAAAASVADHHKDGNIKHSVATKKNRKDSKNARDVPDDSSSGVTTTKSVQRLKSLAVFCREAVNQQTLAAKGSYQHPFQGYAEQTKKKQKKFAEDNIQPRPKDYGGLGLARPSLFLSYENPAFERLLEDEFQEHIDGFFGKQRTKAMKKQLDGKMLWRQMANVKRNNQKVDGKKLADMTPDQRVEAMLKAGLL